jgi:hypothetical protein
MCRFLVFVIGLLAAGPVCADHYPQTVLRNESLSLAVYLPDAHKGFYRGTRFDWAGVIGKVEFGGRHKVFLPWKDTHDPTNYDDIVGPVEEFGMEAPLGYAAAKEGERFLKIGVGELVKPKEEKYRFYHNYQIKRPGVWNVTTAPTEVVFKQAFLTKSGYGYRYTKRVTLDAVRSAFTLHHELTNTGTRPIDTDHYNHNFFNIDSDQVGPNYKLTFPASVKVKDPKERFQELLAVRLERDLVFIRPLDKGSVFATLDGLAGQTGPIILKHSASGMQVNVEGDAPFEKVNVWGTPRVICPEPFIRIRLKPGESKTWFVRYTFSFPKP